MSLNNLSIIGNIGTDPKSRHTQKGFQVTYFRIAVNEWRNDEKVTTWFSAVAFKGRAEYILKTCQKGTKVYLEGPLKCDQFDDKEKYEMIINKVIVLEGKKENV